MIDYTGTMSLGVVRIWVAITRPSGSSKGVKGSKLSKAWCQWCIYLIGMWLWSGLVV